MEYEYCKEKIDIGHLGNWLELGESGAYPLEEYILL